MKQEGAEETMPLTANEQKCNMETLRAILIVQTIVKEEVSYA
jgi:hypothetical protein